ncbi:uncharacterized protein G2W53_003263 [Senna tora]|uniref:Uncharacterized protein n=1 Tax=Senna tora TaxID=362788 RepID=A0A834XA92_9FABA|nr:uncharacterized protein G2W53_003263 [Senna tora]
MDNDTLRRWRFAKAEPNKIGNVRTIALPYWLFPMVQAITLY